MKFDYVREKKNRYGDIIKKIERIASESSNEESNLIEDISSSIGTEGDLDIMITSSTSMTKR